MTELLTHRGSLLFLFGVGLLAHGIRRAVIGIKRFRRDPLRALAILRGFRIGIAGLALACFCAGWIWSIEWLICLSIIIGLEEILESSVAIAALSHGPGIHDEAAA